MRHRLEAIQTAKNWLKFKPIFLDTETTGLDRSAEIIDIAVVDTDGTVLLDTLIKPTHPIPRQATRIHGISNKDVANAPSFADTLPALDQILQDRFVLIYNLDYDTRLLLQSALAHGLSFVPWWKRRSRSGQEQEQHCWHCAMKLYARFCGEWNRYYGNYRWHKLDRAARQCGLKPPKDLHRARADAELTRQVIQYMACKETR